MNTSENPATWSRSEWLFVAVCLLFMGALMFASIRELSPTYDEPVHTVAGLAYWQMHDTRLNPEHPPLMKMLAALPLLGAVQPDYTHETFCSLKPCEWYFSKLQLEKPQLQEWITRARIPMLLVTLLTGLALYAAARRLGGPSGAMLALVVFVTSPFFLGYGPLVANDVLLAGMVLCVCLAADSAWRRQTRASILWMALALAGAWLAKFSAVVIVPVLVLAWMWR